jgi:hypothetical protein
VPRLPPIRLLALAGFAALTSVVFVPTAAAEPRIGVLRVHGHRGAEVEGALARALAAHDRGAVGPRDLEKAARARRASLRHAAGLRAVATRLRLAGFVGARISARGRTNQVTIVVREARGGAIVASARWSGRSMRALATQIERELWPRLGAELSALGRGRAERPPPPAESPPVEAEAPPAPSPEPTPPAPVEAAEPPAKAETPPPAAKPVATAARSEEAEARPTEPDAGPQAAPATLEVVLGPRLLYRKFSYADDPQRTLSGYRTRLPAPALGLGLTWMPRLATPRLGLTLAAELPTTLETTLHGSVYRSRAFDAAGAVLLGVAFRALTLDLALGGGVQRFLFVADAAGTSLPRPLPDVGYRYLRGGLLLRAYPGQRLTVSLGALYRHVAVVEGINGPDWFPDVRARGGEASLAVTLRLSQHFAALLGAEARIYILELKARPDGPRIATQATDQYWAGWLALVASFGGP